MKNGIQNYGFRAFVLRPNLNNIPGIYRITNTVNGKFYIGSAVNLGNRWATHKKDLRKNKHHNTHLQAAWNKYGDDKFVFSVEELIDDKCDLFDREQYYLDTLCPWKKNIGYNKSISAATCIGNKHSEETRRKQSEAAKKRTDRPCGEDNHSSKFTWQVINEIREKYNTGNYSAFQLEKEYGIDRRYISSIINNEVWKDNNYIRIYFKKSTIDSTSEEIKKQILLRRIEGLSWAKLVKEFNLPESSIRKFLKENGL